MSSRFAAPKRVGAPRSKLGHKTKAQQKQRQQHQQRQSVRSMATASMMAPKQKYLQHQQLQHQQKMKGVQKQVQLAHNNRIASLQAQQQRTISFTTPTKRSQQVLQGILSQPKIQPQQKQSRSISVSAPTSVSTPSLTSLPSKTIKSTRVLSRKALRASLTKNIHKSLTPSTMMSFTTQFRPITTTSNYPSFLNTSRLALQLSPNPVLRSVAAINLDFSPLSSTKITPLHESAAIYLPLLHQHQQKRSFASKVVKAGGAAAGDKKKKRPEPEMEELDGGGEELFLSAGDVKKNVRNWLEQILTSKPEIVPMPDAAQKNEELFVKECQTRFAQRLDKRSRYEQAKIIIKQRAIEALPNELRPSALKDDDSLWSMQIIQPFSAPPRKKWLYEHFEVPYKAPAEELEQEESMKKKYARF